MPYNYSIFDLNIESDIEIPFLDSLECSFKNIDLKISKEPSLYSNLIQLRKKNKNYYKINLNKSEIYINDIALFNIKKNGFLINYVVEKKIDMASFFSKLLNHVIPYALYMQNKFVLHASGISYKGSGFLFLGKSGAGKSSLAASLKEMSFACEDSALIDIKNDELFLTPSFNLVKLNTQIHEILKLNYNKIANIKIDKLNRNLYEVENFLKNAVKLKRCYILEWGESFKIEKINNKTIFGNMYSSVFGPHPLNTCKESELFIYKRVTKLLNNIDFYKLCRNKNNFFSDNDNIVKHIQIENL